jgi:hypothetical protein
MFTDEQKAQLRTILEDIGVLAGPVARRAAGD